jgi:hypothetical protein
MIRARLMMPCFSGEQFRGPADLSVPAQSVEHGAHRWRVERGLRGCGFAAGIGPRTRDGGAARVDRTWATCGTPAPRLACD